MNKDSNTIIRVKDFSGLAKMATTLLNQDD